jgi:hypothetical protein
MNKCVSVTLCRDISLQTTAHWLLNAVCWLQVPRSRRRLPSRVIDVVGGTSHQMQNPEYTLRKSNWFGLFLQSWAVVWNCGSCVRYLRKYHGPAKLPCYIYSASSQEPALQQPTIMETQKFRFLDLPLELRLMVYEQLTPTTRPLVWEIVPITSTAPDPSTTELSTVTLFERSLSTAILRVFYTNSFIN